MTSRFRRFSWTIGAALMLAAGLLHAGAGQQSPPPAGQAGQPQVGGQAPQSPAAPTGKEQKPQAEFRAGVNLVRVDVHPTADGKPVTDLAQQDFEVLEDGVKQDIRTFEQIAIRSGGPTETRVEPRNVRESNEMAANDPRARLFVLFIDTYHIHPASAHNVRSALTRFIDRMLAPDDLIAVMTPEMSASSITFTRRPASIITLLDKYFVIGRRGNLTGLDPKEERYQRCYVTAPNVAQEMIARRREKLTLDALEDLVNHLEGLREERKAVLTVTEGWALYRPNLTLGRTQDGRVPGGPPAIGVGPDGRLRVGDTGNNGGDFDVHECDQDRLRMAGDDDDRQFRLLLDVANRGNTTFYPIEPRGLPVFDTDINEGREEPGIPTKPEAGYIGGGVDALHARQNAMSMLASNTDGFTIMNSNDIDANLRKITDDLSSYYILGYSSTNTKLDGKFRAITVRVKRPGVSVRARRGYRAATKEELDARAAGASASAGPASPVSKELGSLAKVRDVAFVRARAGYDWRAGADGAPQPVLWLAAELDPGAGSREPAWKDGADIAFVVTSIDNQKRGEGKQTVTRDARSFLWRLTPEQGMTTGDLSIRLTSKPAGSPLGSSETLHVFVPKPPAASEIAVGQPLLFRRGPFTGAAWVAAGDPRYRRQERVKAEVPVVGTLTAASVRLLDRAGNAMTTIPVVVNRRTENGTEIVSGEVVLAPLTTGDYVLETTVTRGEKTQKTVVAFRIIP